MVSDITVGMYSLPVIAAALWKRELRTLLGWLWRALRWCGRKARAGGGILLDVLVAWLFPLPIPGAVVLDGWSASYAKDRGQDVITLTKDPEPEPHDAAPKPRRSPRRKRNPGKA